MGIVERKERDREEMRDLILEAARTLFLTKGYEKTSIRNIADAIEYSPGTIYLYYKDKNELLFALHEAAFRKMTLELSQVNDISDPFARLVEMGHRYIKYAVENPEMYDLMFVMKGPMQDLACRDEVWEDGLKAFSLLEYVITDCIKAGYFKELDVETAALTIWSYMHGLVIIFLKDRMKMFNDNREKERMQQSYALFVKMMRSSF
ncbi:TetR/AcrR family transcriptional regulator [Arundinibacter roseus]|uniref:TetR/AcrR family transcriptional regulator n=1 Tax=Arundinibacter roseus TaxID=2070510 RepID=A0A4R4KCA2_9BACT|nr:TetR/AcrR family transcriptional regulator [Arundinibacter roseus]TDB64081.1 TetR/AcrR family transcriptional regulator [Arundinibacter roseus]